jgi:hypothetical protein
MIYRCIAPQWLLDETPGIRRVYEGEFTQERIEELNTLGYNIYFLPNPPTTYEPGKTVSGSQIDTFNFIFADMDLKDGKYPDKESFVDDVMNTPGMPPTYLVDSGGGIHAYWQVTDLDAMSYLRLQRRLIRQFMTDEAVGQIYQLMRVPGTVNTKIKDSPKMCEYLLQTENIYTAEEIDRLLPPLTFEDDEYCKQHYEKTYNPKTLTQVSDKLPPKFASLLRKNKEVKDIWAGNVEDRSISDFRLGHILYANDFTREEAMSVLVNSAKALPRAPQHRVSYAENIVDKIWTFEEAPEGLELSSTVREILNKHGSSLKGTRFPCWSYIDNTAHGFRLGQVIGLVAGSGVGKTAMALNMFQGFVQSNPDYDHFFVPLEQPANEIADRWKTMCGEKTHLHDKVHVISNYDEDGSFRHLSFDDIKEYLLKFQKLTGRKVGCVVIDHIGALNKKGKNGENQDLMDICHEMKAFAVQTNTMLIMQSQAPREKAGIGDLELNKDAAYGTVYFESYCDYLITIWQPLKRCYSEAACPTVTAFKFCKIRHKRMGSDAICEDVCYRLYFEPETEHLRELTQEEEKSFDFFNKMSTNARKKDRKTDLVPYKSNPRKAVDGKINSNQDSSSTS